MSDYFSRYITLLGSVDQLTYCQQADSLADLLFRVKTLWGCVLSDNELLDEINRLNQIPVDDPGMLVGNWLPYRYQSKCRLVNWLVPIGYATEPFQDEYISRCLQQLFNQIIRPCSSLGFIHQQANKLTAVQPAGFIFHLSRCGSTLISGCLSELDSTCVFSESPLLTELLLDKQLSTAELTISLQAFINLQAAAFSARSKMIIKWNAWDIFHWEIIRHFFPQVPVIFLVRDPVEILASHQRLAGRHMAGDQSLSGIHSVFSPREESILTWRSKVLQVLLDEMNRFACNPLIFTVDYSDLNKDKICKVAHHFGLDINDHALQKITKRLQFHSKFPGASFSSDRQDKQVFFSEQDKCTIRKILMPAYTQFLHARFTEV